MKVIWSTRNHKGKKYLLATTGMALVASTMVGAVTPAHAAESGEQTTTSAPVGDTSSAATSTEGTDTTSSTTSESPATTTPTVISTDDAKVVASKAIIYTDGADIFVLKSTSTGGKAGTAVKVYDATNKEIGAGTVNADLSIEIELKDKVKNGAVLKIGVANADNTEGKVNYNVQYMILDKSLAIGDNSSTSSNTTTTGGTTSTSNSSPATNNTSTTNSSTTTGTTTNTNTSTTTETTTTKPTTNVTSVTSGAYMNSILANAQVISYNNELIFFSKNIKNGKVGSSVVIKNESGKQIGTGTLNDNGTVSATIKDKVAMYSKLIVSATNKDGKAEQATMAVTYLVLGTADLIEKVNATLNTSTGTTDTTSTTPNTNTDTNNSTPNDKQPKLVAKNGKSYAIADLAVKIVEQANNKSALKIEILDTKQNVKLPALEDRITVKYNVTNGKFYIGDTQIAGTVPKDFALKNKRIVRLTDGSGTTVPHEVVNDTLTFTTYEFSNLLITNSYSAEFEDISNSYSKNEIVSLNKYLIATGTTATQYSPRKEITRAEFAVMVSRALELKPKAFSVDFVDVEGKWYEKEVQALFEAGLIKGFDDGSFGGNAPLTREQATVILSRMLEYMGTDIKSKSTAKLDDAAQVAGYAKSAVNFLAEHEVISSGKGISFSPKKNLNRQEMAKMLSRSLSISSWY
ncbi:MAG: S-layer homology domain-containing protein [Kurthia sp.]|nr:S-layer homology domain-containing protein [Candidatus Kurthia equi]